MATFKQTIVTSGYGNPPNVAIKTATHGFGDPMEGDPEPARALRIFDYYLSLMNFVSGVFDE